MSIVTVVRVCTTWAIMNAHPAPAAEAEPIRLYTSTTTHVGVRFHTDGIGDEAITVQVTATWLSL